MTKSQIKILYNLLTKDKFDLLLDEYNKRINSFTDNSQYNLYKSIVRIRINLFIKQIIHLDELIIKRQNENKILS